MADCTQALVVLQRYIDGELSIERQTSIRYHLDECAHCNRAYGFELEFRTVVRRSVRDAPPVSLRQRVVEALLVEQEIRQRGGERRPSSPPSSE